MSKSTFFSALQRELGKNTGKYFSNLLFGEKHSTPYRIRHYRGVDNVQEKKAQAEQFRPVREQLNCAGNITKGEATEVHEKQPEKLTAADVNSPSNSTQRSEEDANKTIVSAYESYIERLVTLHRNPSEEYDWDSLTDVSRTSDLPSLAEIQSNLKEQITNDYQTAVTELDRNLNETKTKLDSSLIKSFFGQLVFHLLTIVLWTLYIFTVGGCMGIYVSYDGNKQAFISAIQTTVVFFIASIAVRHARQLWLRRALKRPLLSEALNQYAERLKGVSAASELALKELAEEKEEQKTACDFLTAIIDRDMTRMVEVLNWLDPFADLKEFGDAIDVRVCSGLLVVDYTAHDQSVIPREILTITSKGEISRKEGSRKHYNTLYLDFISSCAIRIARDVFNVTRLPEVVVNVNNNIRSTATGQMVSVCVLSVRVEKSKICDFNFEYIDPSDCLETLGAVMSVRGNSKELNEVAPIL